MDKDYLSQHQPETKLLILAKTSPNPDSCLNRVTSIFSPSCIIKYFERLNRRKSPGMDHNHPIVVKNCAFASPRPSVGSLAVLSSAAGYRTSEDKPHFQERHQMFVRQLQTNLHDFSAIERIVTM